MHQDMPFLILQKIDRPRGRVLSKRIAVGIQRMSAQINPQHFLFKLQKHLRLKLAHIRHADHECRPLLLLGNIKETQLAADVALFIIRDFIHHIHVDMDQLLAGKAQGIKGASLDQILHGALVDILQGEPLAEIVDVHIRTVLFPLSHNIVDHVPADPLDGRQTVADVPSAGSKCAFCFVDIRRQNVDAKALAFLDVFGQFGQPVHHRSHQRGHELHREIKLQISGLVADDGISRRMRLVERVLRKVHHIVIDLIGNLLADAVFDTAGNRCFFIAIHKALALCLHDGIFLFRHGPPQDICPA